MTACCVKSNRQEVCFQNADKTIRGDCQGGWVGYPLTIQSERGGGGGAGPGSKPNPSTIVEFNLFSKIQSFGSNSAALSSSVDVPPREEDFGRGERVRIRSLEQRLIIEPTV